MTSKSVPCFAFLTAVLFSFTLSPSRAASCQNAQTTYDQLQCFGAAYDAADDALNAAYNVHRAGLDAQGKIVLRDAQRAWISFRDAECTRQADAYRGGSLARVVQTGCLATLSEERTAVLLHNDVEADAVPDPDEDEPDIIYWLDKTLTGKFDCQHNLTARLGLHPGRDPETFEPNLHARLAIGTHNIDIPIDDIGDGFCGSQLFMSVTDPASSCPGIRVDDGLCDGFFFSWNAQKGTYQYERN